ncbi:MAG: hypothetical protein OEZ34_07585 [Spirochaetia bacterium]|nr:hypothetical protein [Spirochaetia bacterium]
MKKALLFSCIYIFFAGSFLRAESNDRPTQSEIRMDRKVMIGGLASAAPAGPVILNLAYNINPRISLSSYFVKLNPAPRTPPGFSVSTLSLVDSKQITRHPYFGFLLDYFPLNKLPFYFSAGAGRGPMSQSYEKKEYYNFIFNPPVTGSSNIFAENTISYTHISKIVNYGSLGGGIRYLFSFGLFFNMQFLMNVAPNADVSYYVYNDERVFLPGANTASVPDLLIRRMFYKTAYEKYYPSPAAAGMILLSFGYAF